MKQVPYQIIPQVKQNSQSFYETNLWARVFLYQTKKYKYPDFEREDLQNPNLQQDEREMIMLIATELEGLKNTYDLSIFNDIEKLYFTSKVILHNKEERKKAQQDAIKMIERMQNS